MRPASRRPARPAALVGLLAAVGLAACQPAPPPPGMAASAIVPVGPVEARERAEAALRGLGFTVSELPGSAVPTARGELASGADPAWARCAGIWTSDPFSDLGQSRFVQAGARRTVVVVRASTLPQGTAVEVDARTLGIYTHAFTGQPIESPCDSTGVLEGRILAAAAGTG